LGAFVDKRNGRLSRYLSQANASIWFDNFFIGYLYWIAFEWTILSRLGSYTLIQYVRNAADLLPIVLFLVCLVVLNPKLTKTDYKILGGFSLIILLSCLSLVIERAQVVSVVGYIGVTIRFVPLIILVRFTSSDFQEKLFRQVRILLWIVTGLALISLVNKELFLKIFLPPADIFVDGVPTAYTGLGVSGTFVNTVEFSFFILALTTIYLFNCNSRRERLIVSIVTLSVCLMSFSIASLISVLFLLFLRSKRKLVMGSVIVVLATLSIWIFSNFFLELLGMDVKYWIEISSEFNRIGYITKVFPEFLHGSLKDLLLGLGYNGQLIDAKFMAYKNTPWVMINNENNFKYLKDVYWLSIIIAQGLIAFFTTMYILFTIWMTSKLEGTEVNFQIVKAFLLLTLFLGLFSMILDIKSFTFCFWLMAGLAMSKPAPRKEVSLA
jgi:hypothetical protein